MTEQASVPFRLAIRTEGEFVNLYFAPARTMDGAVLVSSVRRSMLEEDRVLFDDWKTALTLAFDRHLRRLGLDPGPWNESQPEVNEGTAS